MAKGAAKRETNAQRREREYNRRTTLGTAKWIAETICERRKSKADLAPGNFADLSAKELKRLGYHPETKRWMQTYTWIGQTLCELCPFDEAPSKFLRLVADYLDGKWPPYSPGELWYDDKITAACDEAIRRRGPPRVDLLDGIGVVTFPWPTFSEYQQIFLEQNAKLPNRPSQRSLRRSIKRLGYKMSPHKRGRPEKK
jgi:hypothetical protein